MMDTKLEEHILKIAEEKSITRAAEKLYLTQSALNQQLLKLEHELGVPLFKRSRNSCTPTAAGELYLEGAKEVVRSRQQTYNRISDLTDSYKGTIVVGMTPVRGPDMFIHVYPVFHKDYPNMLVVPHEVNVYKMQQMISARDLDIGFMTLFDYQKTEAEYENLYKEEILLAVPSSLPVDKFIRKNKEGKQSLPLSVLQNESFILLKKTTTMREVLDKVFRHAHFVPHLLFDTANTTTILELVRAGICCGIVSQSTARNYQKGIQYFSFETPLHWNVAVSYPKGTTLSKAARLFVEYAQKYWLAQIHS